MLLVDIGLIILFATILAFISRLFRQPLILAYIVAGVILGPIGLNLISNISIIQAFAEIGIAFLLFIVGMEINFSKLKHVSFPAILTGFINSAILFSTGFLIAHLLGFTKLEPYYFGIIIAFSSTMLVLKLLSDKEELSTLHGRVIIGVLLLEDLLAILAISMFSSPVFTPSSLLLYLVKGAALLVIALLVGKVFLPPIFKFAAKSQELLFLASISTCFGFALFCYYLNFSIIIGAFIAGVALGTLPYSTEIVWKIKPLKDFFVTLFFVSIGMLLVFTNFTSILKPFLILLGVIWIAKPIILTLLVKSQGYTIRTAALTGISLTQIGEFALIIVSAGLVLGHISQEMFTLTVFLLVTTMVTTSYILKHNNQIFNFLSPALKILEIIPTYKETLEYKTKKLKKPIIIFGGHRTGRVVIDELKKLKKEVIVVDFNPDIIKILMRKRIPCVYGDVSNPDVLKEANIKNSPLVISTIPHLQDNLFLIKNIREIDKKIPVFVTAIHMHEAKTLYKEGASYVILPHILTGEMISEILKKILRRKGDLKKLKSKHKSQLRRYFNHFIELTK